MIVGSLPQACAYATAELLPSGQVILIGSRIGIRTVHIGLTLLALGGCDDEDSPSHDVHSYNPSTSSRLKETW